LFESQLVLPVLKLLKICRQFDIKDRNSGINDLAKIEFLNKSRYFDRKTGCSRMTCNHGIAVVVNVDSGACRTWSQASHSD